MVHAQGTPRPTPEQRYADWAAPTFPAAEYQARRTGLLAALAEAGGGVFLVPSADGVTRGETFRQLDDFLYLTGLELPGALLALDADAGSATLFAPPRDFRFQDPGRANDFPGRPLGDDPAVARAAGLEGITPLAELPLRIADWIRRGRTVWVDADAPGDVPVRRPVFVGHLGPVETLVLRLRSDHPDIALGNAYPLVARARMRKSPAEITKLRAAANATAEAMRVTARSVAPGVTEAALQGAFEASCREQGALRIPFTPIVKSGPNSLWPWRILAAHADRRNRAMMAGELVIQDVGCAVDGYVSDVGRTFPVDGTFTPTQRAKLEMATRVSDAVIAAVRPGVTFADLTRVAYDAIPDDEERHMQTPSYFGHHLGLSSGDPSLPEEPLAPGMVFTIEPWYYNHDLGVSVFVEDVLMVTDDGVEILTRALPRSPAELERMVR
jgi:Xaa-Pro aminopeptidase